MVQLLWKPRNLRMLMSTVIRVYPMAVKIPKCFWWIYHEIYDRCPSVELNMGPLESSDREGRHI
jgi:hypothetical protein